MTGNKRLEAVKQHLTSSREQTAHTLDPIASMNEERKGTTFDVRQLTYHLDGGERITKLKENMMLEFERDPLFKLDDMHDLSKDQLRERTMEKFRSILHHFQNESVDTFKKRIELISLIDPGFWTRFGVHYALFIGSLQSNATPSQMTYWFQKGAVSLSGMIGCFAMTELGHGSNIPGLETTATFEEGANQFIIHTPTLTATKWWIGGAAHTATHAIVFAQLIVRGKRYGTKCFVVPLRDPKTYETLPGVTIGDIGKKMGRDGIDNGWIQFSNVRIPRNNMLMKHTKVTELGKVIEPKLQQLTYGALLQGRVAMVVDSANTAKKALTIGIRYAAVRRQFAPTNSDIETKLLDYPIHQRRLMPLLAQAFAMHFTGSEMTEMYNDMMGQLDSATPDDLDMDQVIEALKETHATSAGLKAFCTWNCLHTIEQCRQACGGHGYSAYTGLAGMYNDFAVQCTWEGDNTILTLQSGRYLINSYREAIKGKKLAPGVGYLNELGTLIGKRCAVPTLQAILHPDVISEGWRVVCANVVKNAAIQFETCLANGMDVDDAFEECSQARLYAARLHTYAYLYNRFADGVAKVADERVRAVLTDVCMLYGLYTIEENDGAFLQYEYFTPKQMQFIRAQVNVLCKVVRQQAIPLVDAFNFSDYIINSALGRFDGNVYIHYFEQVKRANPPPRDHPYFERLIKPLLERRIPGQDDDDDDDEDDEPESDLDDDQE